MLPKHEKRWDRRKHEAGHALPLYAALRILDDLPALPPSPPPVAYALN